MRKPLLWRSFISVITPRRSLIVVKSDMLPEKLPRWNLVVARDGDEDWSIGLRCPCGCGQRLEMMLLPGVKPRWDISVDRQGHVSLHPSVWLRTGCRSHFWVRGGKIVWCD